MGYSKQQQSYNEPVMNGIEYSNAYISEPVGISSPTPPSSPLFKTTFPMLVPNELAKYMSKNHDLNKEQLHSVHRGLCDYLSYMEKKLPQVQSIYVLGHLQFEFLKALYETRDMHAFVAADQFHKYALTISPTFDYMNPNLTGFKPFGLSRVVSCLDYLDTDKPDSFNQFLLGLLDSPLEDAKVFNGTYLYKEADGTHGDFNTKGPKWSCLFDKILNTNPARVALLIEHGKFDFSHSSYKEAEVNPAALARAHAKAANTDIVLKALDNVGIKHKAGLWDMVMGR